ncbi:uncharacterized protein UBRO_02968 [Ustilago bromivora]|uniref:Uncharacterized protein n=1 Tax=Ustilago bromivora TaxID=307758 RepID=A0A1K0HB66_9BASI|nr:uncharacterized protein UBRO_02968 [Ustilago bromivora]
MRSSVILSLLTFALIASLIPPCIGQADATASVRPIKQVAQSDAFDQLIRTLSRSLSPTKTKEVIQKAPDILKLRSNNFLGTGLRRKSIAGAYGTSIAVTGGAGAILYQGLNLDSRNREQENKDGKDRLYREAICAVLQEVRKGNAAAKTASLPPSVPEAAPALSPNTAEAPPLAPPSARWQNRYKFGDRTESDPSVPPELRPKADWDKRALSDAALTAIEEYNKLIAGTEAIVSGSLALVAAAQAHHRSHKPSPLEFYC